MSSSPSLLPASAGGSFPERFEAAGRPIGRGAPVFVIAEAGVALFGSLERGFELLRMAVAARADCFKIQIFDVDALFAAELPEWRDRLRPRNLAFEEVRRLKEACDREGLLFTATAHDPTRIGWLLDLDLPVLKIGSGERNNTGFIEALARLGKPIILSTGMYRDIDVTEAVETCADAGCRALALLHCVSSYPTPDADVNLAAMDRLADLFPGPVGYSDHTPDHLAALAAVARGARIIEKHITVLRDIPNAQDWKVSCGPEDFPAFIENIRRVEAMIGRRAKQPTGSEEAALSWALKSLVAAHPLAAGHVLRADDIAAKRPGTGISPNRIGELIGRKLLRDVVADHLFTPGDLG
jgi:N-acetylneuraminate synthase/N,N'-diacetyllegionaminate synthase